MVLICRDCVFLRTATYNQFTIGFDVSSTALAAHREVLVGNSSGVASYSCGLDRKVAREARGHDELFIGHVVVEGKRCQEGSVENILHWSTFAKCTTLDFSRKIGLAYSLSLGVFDRACQEPFN